MNKTLGFIGLGKMGTPMVQKLRSKGWTVFGFDIDSKVSEVASMQDMAEKLSSPKTVFLMVPAGNPVDEVLRELKPMLQKGDIVIDGGNSFYKDSQKRASELSEKGIAFLDTGVSGGPVSIQQGRFAIMVGGNPETFAACQLLFSDLSDTAAVYMGSSGAGHFTKMIHNGIEYGMMQSLAEGFSILKHSPLNISLKSAAQAYSSNSIISSRLVDWLGQGFEQYGPDLHEVSGIVGHTGEGEWTVKTAYELGVQVPAIESAFRFRVQSAETPSYTGKILSMLRAVFGEHDIGPKR